MFKAKIEEEEEKEIFEDECTRECPESFDEMPEEEQFVETYRNIEVDKEDLPQFT